MANIDIELTLSTLRNTFTKCGFISKEVVFDDINNVIVREGVNIRLKLSLSHYNSDNKINDSSRTFYSFIDIIMIGSGTTYIRMYDKPLFANDTSYKFVSDHDSCWSYAVMSEIKELLWSFHHKLPYSTAKCFNDRQEFGYIDDINRARVSYTKDKTITNIEVIQWK